MAHDGVWCAVESSSAPSRSHVAALRTDKLFAEYGNNPHAVYGTLNNIGAMRGNKVTPKGERMQAKHDAKVKASRVQAPRIQAPMPQRVQPQRIQAPQNPIASQAAALASHPHAARLGKFLHAKKVR
jgi:hypothetical protein